MSILETIQYYQNLLIKQYRDLPKASGMVGGIVTPALLGSADQQELKFSFAPTGGTFKLSYDGIETASIAWNADAVTIESTLQAILVAPLVVEVSGSIDDTLLFTFTDYDSSLFLLSVSTNALTNSPIPVIASVGTQLPQAIGNAFNLIGSDTAVGVQLDTLGKYAGVSRYGYGFNGPVTLDDTDFLVLIKLAIVRNSAGSSLAEIQRYIHQFFPGEIYVFDYQNMNMSYLILDTIGSQNLLEMFVTTGLLPKPMGVGLSVIVTPVIDQFFGFITYDETVNPLATPFNDYDDYNTDWVWVSYDDAVIQP